jgi:excisionase family DNA binding protein
MVYGPAMATDELLPIGEVARRFGVSVETIRRWERAGRLTSNRTPMGHRRFSISDVEALKSGTADADNTGMTLTEGVAS